MPATHVSYVLYMNYYRERERKKKNSRVWGPSEAISVRLCWQNFSGGAWAQTPLDTTCSI